MLHSRKENAFRHRRRDHRHRHSLLHHDGDDTRCRGAVSLFVVFFSFFLFRVSVSRSLFCIVLVFVVLLMPCSLWCSLLAYYMRMLCDALNYGC